MLSLLQFLQVLGEIVDNLKLKLLKNHLIGIYIDFQIRLKSQSFSWVRKGLKALISESVSRVGDTHLEYMREEVEEHYKLPGGIYTTAEPRPNAYIPDDDSELPIPRPYGSLAPFKPTEPGSTMRHIRKPIIKPIEI